MRLVKLCDFKNSGYPYNRVGVGYIFNIPHPKSSQFWPYLLLVSYPHKLTYDFWTKSKFTEPLGDMIKNQVIPTSIKIQCPYGVWLNDSYIKEYSCD